MRLNLLLISHDVSFKKNPNTLNDVFTLKTILILFILLLVGNPLKRRRAQVP